MGCRGLWVVGEPLGRPTEEEVLEGKSSTPGQLGKSHLLLLLL